MNDKTKTFKLPYGSSVHLIDMEVYHMELHSHDALQVLVPLDHAHFEIKWALEDKTFDSKMLGAGDICIIPPYLEHEVRWLHKSHMINMYLSPELIAELLGSGEDAPEQLIVTQIGIQDKFILQLCNRFSSLAKRSCAPVDRILNSIVTLLCHHIYDQYVLQPQAGASFVNSIEQLPCERVRTAAMYMSQTLDRNLTMDEIADQAGMSSYHMIRIFREMMGVTPSKLHMIYRLEEAKKRLVNTKDSLSDISYDLGFSSQAHFSKVFSKHFGDTPKKFRMQHS